MKVRTLVNYLRKMDPGEDVPTWLLEDALDQAAIKRVVVETAEELEKKGLPGDGSPRVHVDVLAQAEKNNVAIMGAACAATLGLLPLTGKGIEGDDPIQDPFLNGPIGDTYADS